MGKTRKYAIGYYNEWGNFVMLLTLWNEEDLFNYYETHISGMEELNAKCYKPGEWCNS